MKLKTAAPDECRDCVLGAICAFGGLDLILGVEKEFLAKRAQIIEAARAGDRARSYSLERDFEDQLCRLKINWRGLGLPEDEVPSVLDQIKKDELVEEPE